MKEFDQQQNIPELLLSPCPALLAFSGSDAHDSGERSRGLRQSLAEAGRC